jgi:hypothetical protein
MALRREIQEFADIMEYKMSVHDDRGVLWKLKDLPFYVKRIGDEYAELNEKLAKGMTVQEKQYEFADIANFCMMGSWKVQDDWANECAARMERAEERKRLEERR